jgi:hypothetical protein
MSGAIILAIVFAAIAAVAIELAKRPFRNAWAWARKWARLVRDLPRLNLAVENIAWQIAHEEADYGATEEDHQQAIRDLHDYLTTERAADGLRLKPRSPFG